MKIKSSDKEFTRDAILLAISALLVKLFGIIYKVPLSYMLTDEGMGYFNSAYVAFGGVYVVCTAGVPKAISIIISHSHAVGREAYSRAVLNRALTVFLSIGSFFALILALFAGRVSELIGNSYAAPSVISIAISLPFVSVAGVMRGYLNGHSRHLPVVLCELTEAVFKLVFGLVLAKYSIKCGHSLPITAAFSVGGISIGAAFSALLLFICIGREKEKTNDVCEARTGEIIVRILKISMPIALGSLAMSATNLIDLSLIMKRLGDIGYTEGAANTLYGNYTTLAAPFLGLAMSLSTPVSIAALPKISAAYASKNREEYITHLKNAVLLSSFVGAALSFGCMNFSYEILSLIFSDESAAVAAPYLAMLSPSFILAGVLITVNTALEAIGKTAAPLISMLFASIAKGVLSYYLIGNENIGIGGAAIGTVAFYAVAIVISLVTLFICTSVRIGCFAPMLICIINSEVSAFVAKMIQELTIGNRYSPISIVIVGCIYAILYLVLSSFTAFWKKEENIFGDNAQKVKRLLLKRT